MGVSGAGMNEEDEEQQQQQQPAATSVVVVNSWNVKHRGHRTTLLV
jgi:hypothetical protein